MKRLGDMTGIEAIEALIEKVAGVHLERIALLFRDDLKVLSQKAQNKIMIVFLESSRGGYLTAEGRKHFDEEYNQTFLNLLGVDGSDDAETVKMSLEKLLKISDTETMIDIFHEVLIPNPLLIELLSQEAKEAVLAHIFSGGRSRAEKEVSGESSYTPEFTAALRALLA